MFGWKEVYLTMSINEYAKARDAVEQGGIRYKWKVTEISSAALGGPNMRSRGTMGINMDFTKQYYIYVKKQDAEQAQYLINKALHG